MPRAIVMRPHGDPGVLRVEDVAVGQPGPAQVRLRQTAVGVNFHDIYVRTGLYRTFTVPGNSRPGSARSAGERLSRTWRSARRPER